MKEMSRKEIILVISDSLMHFDNHLINAEAIRRASIIYDDIELPEIKVGMIGKFWDNDTKSHPMYGCLDEIRSSDIPGNYKTTTEHIFDNFQPMTPDEIKKELKEMIE